VRIPMRIFFQVLKNSGRKPDHKRLGRAGKLLKISR